MRYFTRNPLERIMMQVPRPPPKATAAMAVGATGSLASSHATGTGCRRKNKRKTGTSDF